MKTSKFTYMQLLESGDMLLYNSLVGSNSFIKICNTDVAAVKNCIQNPNSYIGSKMFNMLTQYGMIVDDDLDEHTICSTVAWKRIYSPVLSLVIMPTEDCNFRCSYCYEEHKTGIMSDATANSIVKYVAKNISQYTELNVTWFGGEPLMNEDTMNIVILLSDELLKICSCARKKYSASIITNGYNLTIETFEKLLRSRIFSYQVTIDGIASNHDKYRYLSTGEHTYDHIINNLLAIKNKCKKTYFSIVIRTNISSEMEDTIVYHYSDLSQKFADDSRFSFFFRPVGNWGGESVKQLCNYLYDPCEFKRIYRLISDIQPKLNLNFGRFASFYDNSTCSACYENSYIIGFDGKIYKCSCHFEEKDNNVGYLDDNGNLIVNYLKKSKWVRAPRLSKACSTCKFAPACNNMACPVYSNDIKPNGEITDCPYEKKYIAETLILLNNSGCFKTIDIN